MNVYYTEIQDGCQKYQENDFWEKSPVDSAVPWGVKKISEITLSPTVSEINTFFILCRNLRWPQKIVGKEFLRKVPVNSGDTLGVKHLAEIALSCTVSEINAVLHFTQKFKMPPKNGGKRFQKRLC